MSRTRIVSYLDDELLKSLNELCKNSERPLSHIISELVDIGYRVKQHHDVDSNQQDADSSPIRSVILLSRDQRF